MANHGSTDSQSHDFADHEATYDNFIRGSIAGALVVGFVLVALVSFAFATSLNVLLGFAGLILGVLAVLIDTRAGNRWFLSGGLLVIFGLITAVAVS
ncbi:MAG: aa3-type cytochrome c oxidase subunit IV [Hyphomicrobiales bacterium]